MLEIIVAILTFLAVVSAGSALMSVARERRRRLNERLGDRQAVPGRDGSPMSRLLERVGQRISPRRVSRSLAEDLAYAGYYGQSAATVYLGAKIVLLVATGTLVPLVLAYLPLPFSIEAMIFLSVAGLAFFLPNMIVAMRRRERTSQMREHLPNAVDLLEVCVSSGMGLDMAWNVVTDEIRRVGPALADEMALTSLEINLGAPRADAMRHMVDRTRVEEIGSLVTMLVQAERFGTSIADALQSMAGSMRERRSFMAQEKSEKTAVKLLFPMLLFIFPAVFIVLVGPAGIRLYELMFAGG